MNFKPIPFIIYFLVVTVHNEPLSKYYSDNNDDISGIVKKGAEFFLQRVEGKRGAEFFLRKVVGKRNSKLYDQNRYPLVFTE